MPSISFGSHQMAKPEMLTADEYAERLRITPSAFRSRRYRAPESLAPAVRIGRSLRFRVSDIEEHEQKNLEENPREKSSETDPFSPIAAQTSRKTASSGKNSAVFRVNPHPRRDSN